MFFCSSSSILTICSSKDFILSRDEIIAASPSSPLLDFFATTVSLFGAGTIADVLIAGTKAPPLGTIAPPPPPAPLTVPDSPSLNGDFILPFLPPRVLFTAPLAAPLTPSFIPPVIVCLAAPIAACRPAPARAALPPTRAPLPNIPPSAASGAGILLLILLTFVFFLDVFNQHRHINLSFPRNHIF